jgi:nitrate reductase gamma subunit
MVYGAGLLYHAGIFCALALLAAETFVFTLPGFAVRVLRLGLAIGAAAGVGILVKRAVRPLSRALSRTEDYAANILVDLFLLAGWAATLTRTATAPFLGISILLFVYIPLGKIRHCLFFFPSRIFFGGLFGRRGVLPPVSKAS